jgi:signal transduction histidine kinase
VRLSLFANWCGVLAVAAIITSSILLMHQTRPSEGALSLREGSFAPLASPDPPVHEAYHTPVSLPDDWRWRDAFGDVGWYRIDLDLEVAPDRLWGLYVPSLEMTPQIYLNGVLIGGAEFREPLPRYWNRPLYFAVPSGLLRPGHNQIEVRLAANGHWGRLSEMYIGPEESVHPYYQGRYELRVSAVQVILIFGLTLSLFIAALYVASRELIYGWFALFGLGWTLENYFVLTVDVPVPNDYWDLFIFAVLSFLVVTGSLFTLRFLDIRRTRWERLVLIATIAGPMILLLILLVDQAMFSAASTVVWLGALLVLMIYPLWLMARAVARMQNLDVAALSCCYAIVMALAVHDWTVVTGLGNRHDGLMLQYAAVPTFGAFGLILIRRFIVALREREALQLHLEDMVDQKTREVQAAYQHNQELELQQTLLAERSRLMRDMHDGIGSQLIGLVSRLSPDAPREREISRELRQALDDLRMMIDSLDEVDDDLVGVLGLFRHRIQPQLDDAGLTLHWQMDDLDPVADFGPERVLHLLRMLQETVTNVIKHAHASEIWIRTIPRLVMNGQCCIGVEIEDDGRGLPVEVDEGRGFRNLRHRAHLAGLQVSIEATGHGTRIRIGVPSAHN